MTNIKRLQPDIGLLSDAHRRDFERQNDLLRESGEEETTVSEFLSCRLEDAAEDLLAMCKAWQSEDAHTCNAIAARVLWNEQVTT